MMYDDWSVAGNNGWKDMFAGHLGTTNCLFVDGHVKSMRPMAMGTPVNMWGTMRDNTGDNCSTGGSTGPGSPGLDAYVRGINCDQASPGMVANMKLLEDKYK